MGFFDFLLPKQNDPYKIEIASNTSSTSLPAVSIPSVRQAQNNAVGNDASVESSGAQAAKVVNAEQGLEGRNGLTDKQKQALLTFANSFQKKDDTSDLSFGSAQLSPPSSFLGRY